MPVDKVVVLGGSAGAIPSLIEIVGSLPANFPAAVCVVVHLSPSSKSLLPKLLGRQTGLHPGRVESGVPLAPGHFYVTPPDLHMIIEKGHISLSRGPRENHCRPSIDVLFRSAALSCGAGTTGVLLSGFLDDGVAGLLAIRQGGGVIVVQDPTDSHYPDLLRNALVHVKADLVLRVGEIAPALVRRMSPPWAPWHAPSETREAALTQEVKMAKLHSGKAAMEHPIGKASTFVCPECRGPLWEIDDASLLRFRCYEGHAYSPLTMAASQAEALEAALWTALRSLDERAELAERLADRAKVQGQNRAVDSFSTQARLAMEHSRVIRRVLEEGLGGPPYSPNTPDEPAADAATGPE